MADLGKIGARERLKPRAGDEPHWERLGKGSHLGFRPSKRGGRGTWFARAFDEDANKYRRKALGDYGEFAGHDVYKQAKADAERWGKTVESGGFVARKLETVKDACEAYLEHKPGAIAEGVFQRHVYSDPVAKVKIDKLRRHHLQQWRDRLEAAPARSNRSKKIIETKVRSKATVNRDMVPLRAALNQVLVHGAPKTDAAWQEALVPIKGADKARTLYLDRGERKRLLNAVGDEATPFVRALCLLPLRPGALAKLLVRDFDKRTRALTVGQDKNGKPRQITLPETIAEFLNHQSKDKLPATPIFARADGRPWNKDAWKHPIKEAVVASGVPTGTTAYTLRHSVITDLIRVGLPALTVAQLSGTSVAMIERHYGHLVRDDAENALASLAL